MASTIHEFLDEMAARAPDKTAIVADEGAVSYGALAADSRRLAGWLRRAGVQRGDRVALLLPNGIPVVTALMAASRLAAMFCVVNPAVKPYHLRHILEDAAPALIITTRQRDDLEQVGACAPMLLLEDGWAVVLRGAPLDEPFAGTPGDPACLIYTSGSTGKPKAVISSH